MSLRETLPYSTLRDTRRASVEVDVAGAEVWVARADAYPGLFATGDTDDEAMERLDRCIEVARQVSAATLPIPCTETTT